MSKQLLSNLSAELQTALLNNVRDALAEDISTGDLTAQLIPATQIAHATLISRENAVICGLPWLEACIDQIDPTVSIQWHIAEGETVEPNQAICELQGNARSILTAERAALNFVQLLSATATQTRLYVDAIKTTKARILDTRKTLPGLRLAQKYAVTIGGGLNQRLGLYDGILIKENHIAAAGSIEAVLNAADEVRKTSDTNITVQIEVENLHQLKTALDAGAKLILLDNFDIPALAEAVKLNAGKAILEASGGINLDNVLAIAQTGVDRISIGAITKHVKAIDLSLRFKEITL
ncbi:carboxylating nicotinate-nucleotide diphosphorylase [Methyloradius palustris]|uniref:Probable nicotinate-nucleotide pyrophosphorylase [carboxylating] n=1 Tax=Methyloradius palustris TaxID=2778876 RepID=A0A8D5GFF7_9PROT|nr:carboxylating nicotinate-nucleotide diphosphorylase [Methyloradius palustris]BCM25749.1 nicotinate-nucleotide diphosphorylase (carboxylating) [Methyloradius palustris]